MTEYVLIVWLLAVMCSCVGVVAHITCKPKRKATPIERMADSITTLAEAYEMVGVSASEAERMIAGLERELADIRADLPVVKGIAHKALTIAEAGLEAELAIITASASVGGRDALEQHINELEHVLSARTTPYGRDSKGLAYSGVPGYVLDVKWGILKSYMEVEV